MEHSSGLDKKRFNYLLVDELGNKAIISSKYIFKGDEIQEFVKEARECYCDNINRVVDHLIKNHEFEVFEIEARCEI